MYFLFQEILLKFYISYSFCLTFCFLFHWRSHSIKILLISAVCYFIAIYLSFLGDCWVLFRCLLGWFLISVVMILHFYDDAAVWFLYAEWLYSFDKVPFSTSLTYNETHIYLKQRNKVLASAQLCFAFYILND